MKKVTGAKVYASSYDDDYRDEAFAGTPSYKDDKPLFETNDFMPEDFGGYEQNRNITSARRTTTMVPNTRVTL